MSHITVLLILLFYKFLQPLVEAGMVYVGLPPKYRYQDKRGNFYYIKNDEDLPKFEINFVTEDITSHNYDLNSLLEAKVPYMRAFNQVLGEISCTPEFLTLMLTPPPGYGLEELATEVGLSYEEETGHITGIYEGEWHDFYEADLQPLLNRIESHAYMEEKVHFTYKGEEYEMFLYDFFQFINSEYDFKYTYFKGRETCPSYE